MLLGAVVADGVDPDDLALGRDLDRAGDDGHIDVLAGPGTPDPIAGPGERDRATTIDSASDGHACSWRTGASGPSRSLGLRSFVGSAPLGMGGDEDPAVKHLDEARTHDHFDGFPGEGWTDPIAQSSQRDGAALVDPAVYTRRTLGEGNLVWDLRHLEVGRPVR
jgi:hypothetical protein